MRSPKIKLNQKSIVITNQLKETLIKRNNFFKVESIYLFNTEEFHENFKKILTIKFKDKNKDIIANLNEYLMHRYQKKYHSNYLNILCRNDETASQRRDRTNSYITNCNYFLKEIKIEKDRIKVVLYIKPSKAISPQLKAIKTKFNNWYFHYKLYDFGEINSKKDIRNKNDVPKDRVLGFIQPMFEVFNIEKQK